MLDDMMINLHNLYFFLLWIFVFGIPSS